MGLLFQKSLSEGETPAFEQTRRRTFGIWFNSVLMAFWGAVRVAALVVVNVQPKPHTVSDEVGWIAWAVVFGVLATGFFFIERWAWGGAVLHWAVQTGLGLSRFILLLSNIRTFEVADAMSRTIVPLLFLYFLLSEDCLNAFRIRKQIAVRIATSLIAVMAAATGTILLR